ncbi:MAG: hypothetical protein ACFE8B_17445 [Candidatus Hermodarchaeota archaeon]
MKKNRKFKFLLGIIILIIFSNFIRFSILEKSGHYFRNLDDPTPDLNNTDEYHVVSVTGTNEILTDQLMYDDEIKYEINNNYSSTGKGFDGYTFGFNRGSVSTNALTVTPTEGMAVKDDAVIYSTWAVRGGVAGAMTFWQTFTFNLNNLQTPWNESLYLLGFTLHYDIFWDAYNLDSMDRYPWSNLYILNNELNQWELIKEEPFIDGSWVDSNSSKFCPKETDPSLFTKKYISNNRRIQFRFKEYSDCSRYNLDNAFHTIHWDFLSLDIFYLNSEREVEFHFTNGLLDGENDFYLWFQGNTKGGIAQLIVNNESIFPLCMSESTVRSQFPMSVILNDISSIKIKFQTASSLVIDYLFLKLIEIPAMNIEILSQIFSTEKFNITFFVYNDSGQGIDFATIQMSWNGTDVSNNIQNLGEGLYHVSLDPITTLPGEDPILLNMTLFADGYKDKQFETYLAVDPDTLYGKDSRPPITPPEVILTTILITFGSIGGLIGLIIYLFKRKGTPKQY